jgi:hypothetical protein
MYVVFNPMTVMQFLIHLLPQWPKYQISIICFDWDIYLMLVPNKSGGIIPKRYSTHCHKEKTLSERKKSFRYERPCTVNIPVFVRRHIRVAKF